MTEEKLPRILILENGEAINSHARTILVREGFDVICEKISKNALVQLKESKASPFSLFISSSTLPGMDGDEILKNAKTISPLTQRMLMVTEDKPDLAIRAINKGEINSCILYPFTDEDLISQTKKCAHHFLLAMKRKQSKKITGHRNKQLFQIAQKLKKKDHARQELLGEKKNKKLMLRSDQRKARKDSTQKEDISLEDRINQIKTPVEPESFQNEFIKLCDYIKALFDSTASKADLDPVPFDLPSIFSMEPQKILPDNSSEPNEQDESGEAIYSIISSHNV